MNTLSVPAASLSRRHLLLAGAGLLATAAFVPLMQAAPAQAATSAPAVPSTQTFVDTAAVANRFEIVSSELALKKTKDPEVVAFARQMITDHTKIGEGFVKALGKAHTGLTPPAGLNADLEATMKKLQAASGDAFVKAYVAAQLDGHKAAVGLFGGYASGGDNKVLKSFAGKVLPTIEHHLMMAETLAKKYL